ncbi:MAG: tRNA-i(6)A37 thiotransferase enzyme MiaB, partial [Armatimonadetes bacterium OLB18]
MPQALVRASDLLLPTRATSGRGQYFIQTWGCQMNEEDSVQMARYLEEAGFAPARTLRDAQVVLLNTCSVRSKPEQKAFSMLGEVGLLKREKPELIVGVCGCMAQLRSDEIKRRAPFVDFVIGTGQVATLPGLVEEAAQARKFRTRLGLPERKGAVVTDVPRRIAPRYRFLRWLGENSRRSCRSSTGATSSARFASSR